MRRFLVYLLLFLFYSSCSSQDGKLSTNYKIQDDPLKVMVIKNYSDSTRVLLMLPIKIEINNSNNQSIKFTNMSYSQSGANIYSRTGPKLYEYVNNQLKYSPIKNRIVNSKSNESYKLYMAYNATLAGTNKKIIFKDSVFSQIRNKKIIFNIPNTELNLNIYREKIPDSIKGFIHLNYTNPKTNQFDYLNIPVKF